MIAIWAVGLGALMLLVWWAWHATNQWFYWMERAERWRDLALRGNKQADEFMARWLEEEGLLGDPAFEWRLLPEDGDSRSERHPGRWYEDEQ